MQHVALAGEVDDLLHELEVDAGRSSGCAGTTCTITRGLGPGVLPRLDAGCSKKSRRCPSGTSRMSAPAKSGPVDVDRVRRATAPARRRPGCSSTHMRWEKPSLAPMVLITSVSGSSVDAEPALVEVGDRLAQLRDAPARRVAVVAGVVGRLGQLLDRDVGRRQVGVAEPRSMTSLAGSPGLDLQRVDDGEDVGRQRRDPAELHSARGYRVASDGCGTRFRRPVAKRAAGGAGARGEQRRADRAGARARAWPPRCRRRGPWRHPSTCLGEGGAGHGRGRGRRRRPDLHRRAPAAGSSRFDQVGQPERDPPAELAERPPSAPGSPSRAAAVTCSPRMALGLAPGPAPRCPSPRPAAAASRARRAEADARGVALPAAPAPAGAAAARRGRRPCGPGSPANPRAPRCSRPSMTSRPPMPVPRVTSTTCRAPRARRRGGPRPTPAQLASLSTTTGQAEQPASQPAPHRELARPPGGWAPRAGRRRGRPGRARPRPPPPPDPELPPSTVGDQAGGLEPRRRRRSAPGGGSARGARRGPTVGSAGSMAPGEDLGAARRRRRGPAWPSHAARSVPQQGADAPQHVEVGVADAHLDPALAERRLDGVGRRRRRRAPWPAPSTGHRGRWRRACRSSGSATRLARSRPRRAGLDPALVEGCRAWRPARRPPRRPGARLVAEPGDRLLLLAPLDLVAPPRGRRRGSRPPRPSPVTGDPAARGARAGRGAAAARRRRPPRRTRRW